MRVSVLLCALLALSGSQNPPEQVPPDGVYVSIEPILGRAMVGSNAFDAAFISTGRSMKQYVGESAKVTEVFGIETLDVGLVAESHGGEIWVRIRIVRNGRVEHAEGGSGKHVTCHYGLDSGVFMAPFNDHR